MQVARNNLAPPSSGREQRAPAWAQRLLAAASAWWPSKSSIAEVEVVEVPAGRAVTLPGARGGMLHGGRGTAWVTQPGLRRDVILGPGESLRFGRDGDLVVSAITDVRVALARGDRGRIVSLESLARLVHAVRD